MTQILRRLLTVLPAGLLLTGGGFLWLYGGALALSGLNDDYSDGSDSVYLIVGGMLLALGTILVAAAVLLLWNRQPGVWWVFAGVAFIAGLLPYAPILGDPGFAFNVLFLVLALGSAVVAWWMGNRRQLS